MKNKKIDENNIIMLTYANTIESLLKMYIKNSYSTMSDTEADRLNAQSMNNGKNCFTAAQEYVLSTHASTLFRYGITDNGRRTSTGMHPMAIPYIRVWVAKKEKIIDWFNSLGKGNSTSRPYSYTHGKKFGLGIPGYTWNPKDEPPVDLNDCEIVLRDKSMRDAPEYIHEYLIIASENILCKLTLGNIRKEFKIPDKIILIQWHTKLRTSRQNDVRKYNNDIEYPFDKKCRHIINQIENGCKDKIIDGHEINYGK